MLVDGLNMAEYSSAKNLTVDSGDTFPISPNVGELFFKSPESTLYSHDGTDWKALLTIKDQLYDISLSYPSSISPTETVMVFAPTRSIILKADSSFYSAFSLAPSTTDTVFSIQKNGIEFGTITFLANQAQGTFVITETSFQLGDVISIVAPSTTPHGVLAVSFRSVLT